MVTVKVVRTSTGRAVQGIRVCIGFDGIFRGMSKNMYSNGQGEAHFDNDPGQGEIYVDGYRTYEGRIAGLTVISIP